MRNDRSHLTARNRWLRSAVFALGLAAAATAQAQTTAPPARAGKDGPPAPTQSAATPANPNSVEGVTVQGRRPDQPAIIPDDKKAQYDADVAREAAFRDYRASRPPLNPDAKGISDPNDQSRDFPGLQHYLPQ